MTRRAAVWTTVFLSVTTLALVMECWASWDGDPDTVPWTYLIVGYVPGEITAFGLGGLIVWVSVHFALRYWHKSRTSKQEVR